MIDMPFEIFKVASCVLINRKLSRLRPWSDAVRPCATDWSRVPCRPEDCVSADDLVSVSVTRLTAAMIGQVRDHGQRGITSGAISERCHRSGPISRRCKTIAGQGSTKASDRRARATTTNYGLTGTRHGLCPSLARGPKHAIGVSRFTGARQIGSRRDMGRTVSGLGHNPR